MVTAISYVFMVARFRDRRSPENHASGANSWATVVRRGAASARRPDKLTFTQPPVPRRKGTGEAARMIVLPEKTWTSSRVALPYRRG
jgi:hypothetical protein